MDWNPSDKGWLVYIHFEERCKELQRARAVFEKYEVLTVPCVYDMQ